MAAGRRQGVAGEHWGSLGEAPSMVTGNEAHRKGVIGGEAARWRRCGGVPTVGSSHGGSAAAQGAPTAQRRRGGMRCPLF
jgi:hypothetical protein